MNTGTLRILKLGAVVFFVSVALIVGYLKGQEDTLTAELKVYYGNLVAANVPADSALVDFLKARYYYLANRIPDNRRPYPARDFGPITNMIAKTLAIGKGPTGADAEYKVYSNWNATLPKQNSQ